MANVYIIRCKLHDKVYVGYTTKTIEERFKQHIKIATKTEANYKLSINIRKHSPENFSVEFLEECVDVATAKQREIFWISQFDSFKSGLNMTPGGDGHGMLGKKHSDETKQKMRLAHVGRPLSEETKRKMLLSRINCKRPPTREETKLKISQAQKRRWAQKREASNV